MTSEDESISVIFQGKYRSISKMIGESEICVFRVHKFISGKKIDGGKVYKKQVTTLLTWDSDNALDDITGFTTPSAPEVFHRSQV